MPYDIRGTVGKYKGKFIKKSTKSNVEKFLEVVKGKQGLRTDKKQKAPDDTKLSFKRFDGCRVINMDKIAADMWCDYCNSPLSFRFLIHERQIGLTSICRIQCYTCKVFHEVATSAKNSASNYHDLNLKLAIAMLDAGIGETKINLILSALNIPTMSVTALKRYERYVGPKLENLARKSCIDAIEREKYLTINSNKDS